MNVMIPLPERLKLQCEIWHRMMDDLSTRMRVASPGIIQSFNAATQTVIVLVAIREKVITPDGKDFTWEDIPELVDVPILIPRAGGFELALPVNAGDECLVVFGDTCMDAWWQSGGVQNQMDRRRHDLSDGYAILGIWSQPRVISNYPTSSVQLRNDAGTAMVEIQSDGTVHIKAGKVSLFGAWQSINANQAYTADTDGILVAFAYGITFSLQTPVGTIRVQASGIVATYGFYASASCAVRKGDTYEAVGAVTAFFLPMGAS